MLSAYELLQGATIFNKLELCNAYHLVHIQEGGKWKMAFKTPTGHYEYQVMPFGLATAPAVFQALINDVLRDMLNKYDLVPVQEGTHPSGTNVPPMPAGELTFHQSREM